MPFRSKAQRAFLFAKHPAIARRWAKKYGSGGKHLPKHVGETKVMPEPQIASYIDQISKDAPITEAKGGNIIRDLEGIAAMRIQDYPAVKNMGMVQVNPQLLRHIKQVAGEAIGIINDLNGQVDDLIAGEDQ